MEAGRQLDNHVTEGQARGPGVQPRGSDKVQDFSGKTELLVKQLIAALTDMNNALLLLAEEKPVAASINLTTRIEKMKFMFRDFSEKDKAFGEKLNQWSKEMDELWRETHRLSQDRGIRLDGDYIG